MAARPAGNGGWGSARSGQSTGGWGSARSGQSTGGWGGAPSGQKPAGNGGWSDARSGQKPAGNGGWSDARSGRGDGRGDRGDGRGGRGDGRGDGRGGRGDGRGGDGRGGRGGDPHYDRDREIKRACKKAVERFCITPDDVSQVTNEDVDKMVSDICIKFNVRDEATVHVIHATVMCEIVKRIPMPMSSPIAGVGDPSPMDGKPMGSMEAFCVCLTPSLMKTMRVSAKEHDNSFRVANDGKLNTTQRGFDVVNNCYWPKDRVENMSPDTVEDYCRMVRRIITILGYDLLVNNGKGETALESYQKAVKKGVIPYIPEMEGILSAKILPKTVKGWIHQVLNKATPQNCVEKFGNICKMIAIHDPGLLTWVTTTFDSFLNLGNTTGLVESVDKMLGMFEAMLAAPISEDEWFSKLNQNFGTPPEIIFKAFVSRLADHCLKELEGKKAHLLSKGPDECNAINISVIGACVAASAVIRDDPQQFNGFLTDLLKNPSDEINQKLILAGVAHVFSWIQRRKVPKQMVTRFLTPDIIMGLAKACKERKVSTFHAIHLETSVNKFAEAELTAKMAKGSKGSKKTNTIKAEKLGDFLTLFPPASKVVKPAPVAARQAVAPEPESKDDLTESVGLCATVDLEVGQMVPRFLGNQNAVNDSEEWKDWVYARQKDKSPTTDPQIMGVVVAATDGLFNPKTFSADRLSLFKTLLDETFSETRVKVLTQKFLTAKNEDEDEFRALWETSNGFEYFKKFLGLYGLKY